MRTIYADELFFLNLVIDYLILLLTAKLCALPLKRLRFALSAALGALYAALPLLHALSILAHPLLKLALGAMMVLIAFGAQKRFLRLYLAFFAVSAAFGGAVYAATLLAGVSPETGLYQGVSLRVLALSFAVCYAALTLVFRRMGRRLKREYVSVTVTLAGRTAQLCALRDTGNELFDPVSGLPVMVLGAEASEQLLPDEAFAALENGAVTFMSTISEDAALSRRFRLVPCNSIAGGALLPVFRPDCVCIGGKEHNSLLIGLTTAQLCADGEFSAIL